MIGNPWHCDETIYWLTEWIQAAQVEFFAKDKMLCASPPKLRGKKISELHLSILPKVKKPLKVKPYLEPIDLPIHHGDGNFSFVLNFTTDGTETEDSEEAEQFVNVSQASKKTGNFHTSTTSTTVKPYKKDSMPGVNNEILKRKGKDKLKKRRLKNGYHNDQQKKRHKNLKLNKHKLDNYDTKTRSRGRHRMVETDGSGQYHKDSKTKLFPQLLSQEKDHFIRNTDGSGSAESFEKISSNEQIESEGSLKNKVKPGLFYDAYVRTENQNSGEDDV